jgi:hypothetical protein
MSKLTESAIEDLAIGLFEQPGYVSRLAAEVCIQPI